MICFDEVQKELALVGVQLSFYRPALEYRVCADGSPEGAAYYTNLLEDARTTGLSMAGVQA